MGFVLVFAWLGVWYFTLNEQMFEDMRKRSQALMYLQLKVTCMVLLLYGLMHLGWNLIDVTTADQWGDYFTQGAVFLLIQITYAWVTVEVYGRLDGRGEMKRTMVTGWSVLGYTLLLIGVGVVPFL